jgi:hypothetical protein
MRRAGRAGAEGEGEVSASEIESLLEMAESLLATAEKLPSGPERNDALQTIRGPNGCKGRLSSFGCG